MSFESTISSFSIKITLGSLVISTSTSTPSVAVNTSQEAGETLASTTTTTQATQNRPSLIESLDSNLNSKYQLSELRQNYDERTKIISEVQLSSLYIFGSQIKR